MSAIERYLGYHRWTHEDLAQKIGFDAVQIKKWERSWEQPDPRLVKE